MVSPLSSLQKPGIFSDPTSICPCVPDNSGVPQNPKPMSAAPISQPQTFYLFFTCPITFWKPQIFYLFFTCPITLNLWTHFIYTHHYIITHGSCAQTLGKDTQSAEHQEARASMELLNQEARDYGTAHHRANFYRWYDGSNLQSLPKRSLPPPGNSVSSSTTLIFKKNISMVEMFVWSTSLPT